MTYDPRQSFKAQQAAYSRAAGTQTSKQQGISKGLGTPDYSSSAYDSGGYDEIKLPSAGKVDQKIKTGLGSPSSGTDKKDDRNLDQKIYDGMKYYGAKFLGLDKPDPRADDMFLLEVYGGDDMFVIPEPTPMTINYLDDDGDYLGSYDFIDMSKLGNKPRQPRTQPNIDTAPQIGGYDEAPVLTQPKGLMSPPDPEVPDVNVEDDEMARIAGQTTAPKSEPNTYTVTKGDTLSEIARDYGKTVEELVKINNIKDKDKIYVGQKIKLEADFDDPTEAGTFADPVDAADAAETFTSTEAIDALYTQIGDKESTTAHLGEADYEKVGITLGYGIVPDDGLKYNHNGKVISLPKDASKRWSALTDAGVTTQNFDPDKVITDDVEKGGVKRSDYTSDEEFTKAVIKSFQDSVETEVKAEGVKVADLPEGAMKGLVSYAYNAGGEKYNDMEPAYKEMVKENPDMSVIQDGMLQTFTADKVVVRGLADRRAKDYNDVATALGQPTISTYKPVKLPNGNAGFEFKMSDGTKITKDAGKKYDSDSVSTASFKNHLNKETSV